MGTTPRTSNNLQPNMYWGHQWWLAIVIKPSTQHLLGTPMGVSHGHYTVYPTYIGDLKGINPMSIIPSTQDLLGTLKGLTQ